MWRPNQGCLDPICCDGAKFCSQIGLILPHYRLNKSNGGQLDHVLSMTNRHSYVHVSARASALRERPLEPTRRDRGPARGPASAATIPRAWAGRSVFIGHTSQAGDRRWGHGVLRRQCEDTWNGLRVSWELSRAVRVQHVCTENSL